MLTNTINKKFKFENFILQIATSTHSNNKISNLSIIWNFEHLFRR